MQVPRLKKIVINMGLGEAVENPKIIDAAVEELTRDHRPEAGGHPRQEVDRDLQAARGHADRRDGHACAASGCGSSSTAWSRSACRACATFAASAPKAFDGAGNYTLGLKEQIVFPEIDFDKVDKIKGMNITFVHHRRDRRGSQRAPRQLGMPFRS